jgi:hypothetical protein
VKYEPDDKYVKRLEANKLSAQASRERKKHLKNTLEEQANQLLQENSKLGIEITQLETENKVLKGEFLQLQNLIAQSPIFSKLMAQRISLNLPSVEQMEQKRLERLEMNSKSLPLFTPSQSSDPTALMYLMIVMQTFSQFWNTQIANSAKLATRVIPSVSPLQIQEPLYVM